MCAHEVRFRLFGDDGGRIFRSFADEWGGFMAFGVETVKAGEEAMRRYEVRGGMTKGGSFHGGFLYILLYYYIICVCMWLVICIQRI